MGSPCSAGALMERAVRARGPIDELTLQHSNAYYRTLIIDLQRISLLLHVDIIIHEYM